MFFKVLADRGGRRIPQPPRAAGARSMGQGVAARHGGRAGPTRRRASAGRCLAGAAGASALNISGVGSRLLRLKRPDTCSECGAALEAGVKGWWDAGHRTVICTGCRPLEESAPIERGEAGASAARELERRKAAREKRTRDAHPIIGSALLALRGAPQHESAFGSGAAGERAVGARLDEALAAGPSVVLHDRRMPRGRGNIDHVVVAPSGIFVVDAKDIRGKVRVSTPLFGNPTLLVNGRDRTKLIEGLDRQVATVRDTLRTHQRDVPVRGVLCFTRADLPLLGTLRLRRHELLYRNALLRRLTAEGELDAKGIQELAPVIAAAFPPA